MKRLYYVSEDKKNQKWDICRGSKILLRNNERAAFSVNGDDGYPYTIPVDFYYTETGIIGWIGKDGEETELKASRLVAWSEEVLSKILCRVGKEDYMVLENKLGINDSAGLARMEEKISKKKAVELFESGYLNDYEAGTFQMLAAVHKYLFEQIYDFAGEVRNVNIAKGNFKFAEISF